MVAIWQLSRLGSGSQEDQPQSPAHARVRQSSVAMSPTTLSFTEELDRLYGRMPQRDKDRLAVWTLNKNAWRPRAGRDLKLTPTERVDRAVAAYIRHEYTFYDKVIGNVGKDEAREQIKSLQREIRNRWRTPDTDRTDTKTKEVDRTGGVPEENVQVSEIANVGCTDTETREMGGTACVPVENDQVSEVFNPVDDEQASLGLPSPPAAQKERVTRSQMLAQANKKTESETLFSKHNGLAVKYLARRVEKLMRSGAAGGQVIFEFDGDGQILEHKLVTRKTGFLISWQAR